MTLGRCEREDGLATTQIVGRYSDWTKQDQRDICRLVAMTQIAGAVTAVVFSWIPGSFPLQARLTVTAAAAVVGTIGCVLITRGRIGSPAKLEMIIGTVMAIIAIAHACLPASVAKDVYGAGSYAFYLWTTPILVAILGLAAGFRHTVWSAVWVAAALAYRVDVIGPWVAVRIWLMVVSTMLVMMLFGRYLNQIAFRNEAKRRAAVANAERFSAVIGVSPDVIVICDVDGRIHYANPAARRLIGVSTDGPDPNLFDSALSSSRDWLRANWHNILERGTFHGELEVDRKTSAVPLLVSAYALPDSEDEESLGVAIVGRDISDRIRVEMMLRHQATHDPVTGLPNRRLLHDTLHQALVSGDSVIVVFIDLDDFKLVNDTLGHHAGDEILELVAERLRHIFAPPDAVGRFGGDEFVVIHRGDAGSIPVIRQRTQSLWAEPFRIGDNVVHMSGSAGVALSSGRENEADLLMHEADSAVLAAKSRGRAQTTVFDPSMDTPPDDLDLTQALREALKLGTLGAHYQPIVELKGRRTIGAEALVRWTRPGHGLVSPTRLVSLAERNGLIAALGQDVVRMACRDVARMQRETRQSDLFVTVNVSPTQLLSTGFVDFVRSQIEENGLLKRSLRIEITESVLIEDLDRVLGCLHELRASGVPILLDDFGTGFSSLSYLHQLPVDALKIDASFTQQLVPGERSVIVEAVLALGIALQFSVIAEGIETRLQEDALIDLGCKYGQGHLYSRALPFEELLSTLGGS